MTSPKIKIYTDGSCYYKTKEGGIGVYFFNENRAINKGYFNTSTDRMEIIALLFALKGIKNISCTVEIISDNQYVVNSIKEGWVYEWETSNWSARTNSDLWKKVLKEIRSKDKVKISLRWIKGHQKDMEDEDILGNNIADKLSDYKQFKTRTEDVREK